ncbi:MBL fold metallo-hydrolase [Larkinella sp. VNQ87]|uniref:MBL fold metallo-hydrolase n=1 Tax=Larkinella sp. VNQ87 TaxID=3400921 RepID=UPI003C07AACD
MRFLFVLVLICGLTKGWAQIPAGKAFRVVPLGVKGGVDESNLSAYLLAAQGTNSYVCLDAGTLHAGIKKAIQNQVFKVDYNKVLKDYIKGYLISHAHLDHLAGLVLNSTEDGKKPIYATESNLDIFRKHYFNWKAWPNFGSEGDQPALSKYQYTVLAPGTETPIDGTGLSVRAFPLSHGFSYQSTAFLLKSGGAYALYLGDTGPDLIEKSTNLAQLWKAIQPLVQARTLKALLIEVSYPNEQPDNQLFGHLTPNWLMHELTALSKLTGPDALKDFPVVITHMKPTGTNEAQIKQQLREANRLKVKLIFPEQGKLLEF